MKPPANSFYQRNAALQSNNGGSAASSANAGSSTGAPQSAVGSQLPGQIQQAANQQQVNLNAPMGDPVDTIAQILGLDLSAASSPDQQGQMVVSAVEALVLQLHQYFDQYGPIDGQPTDDGMQDDDTQENFEDDGNEGAEDGEGQETTSTGADDQGVDESEDAGTDDGSDSAPPAPFKKKQAIAASFDTSFAPATISPRVLSMAKQSREMKIKSLCQGGYITPTVAKELSQVYCSSSALSLSLSLDEGQDDGFDRECALFEMNGPVLRMGENFAEQTNFRTLEHNRDTRNNEPSALVAGAEARRLQVEERRKRGSFQH